MKSQRLKFENPQENHCMTVMDFYSIFFYQKIRDFDFPIFRCRQDLQAICCIHALHKDEPANCDASFELLTPDQLRPERLALYQL